MATYREIASVLGVAPDRRLRAAKRFALIMLACISADGGTVRLTAQASFIVCQDLREPTPSF
jgi:hypothetical protein